MTPWIRAAVAIVATGFAAASAHAVVVDGQADVDYGSPLSVQTTSTNLGDTPPDYQPLFFAMNLAIGSELDQAFGFVADGALHLVLAGNFKSYMGEPLIFPDKLEVFVDCASGGQNSLSADNPALGSYLTLRDLAGLKFDAAFSPDYDFGMEQEGPGTDRLATYYSTLPTATGGTGYFLGRGNGGAPGTLTGGTNPYGVLASIDQRSRGGVVAGCAAGSGAGVTMGMEWSIPLAAIGNPAGPIKVCALIARDTGSPMISNQVLGPLPAGTCGLTPAPAVDFSTIPGDQFFTIDAPVPARTSTWGRFKAGYRK